MEKRLEDRMEEMQAQDTKMEGLVGETREAVEGAKKWAVVACILIVLGFVAFINGGGGVVVFALVVYFLCGGITITSLSS